MAKRSSLCTQWVQPILGETMKVGDLVKVHEDVWIYEYLFGHVGVIVKERYNKHWVKVHILGETRGMRAADLEVIK